MFNRLFMESQGFRALWRLIFFFLEVFLYVRVFRIKYCNMTSFFLSREREREAGVRETVAVWCKSEQNCVLQIIHNVTLLYKDNMLVINKLNVDKSLSYKRKKKHLRHSIKGKKISFVVTGSLLCTRLHLFNASLIIFL